MGFRDPFHVPFDGNVGDNGETLSGSIAQSDEGVFPRETTFSTSTGARCSGVRYARQGDVRSALSFVCSDGRTAEITFRQYGRYTAHEGVLGHEPLLLQFPTLPDSRPWVGSPSRR